MPTPEDKLKESVIRWLKTLKRRGEPIWWLKIHGGPMQRAGVPDLMVIYHGRVLFFELKTPGNPPTPLQSETIHRILHAGGFATVVTSVEEVKAELNL
jgi:hypothetical protein